MKKTCNIQEKIFIFCFCIFTGLFFISCGLEEVISVDSPSVNKNGNALYSNDNYLDWYFDFVTEEDSQSDEFIGTDIYYKIYNNSSALVSQRNAILAKNYSTYGSASASLMIDTYTFQPLGTSSSTGNVVFFPSVGRDHRVVLRLKNYKDGLGEEPEDTSSDEYAAYVENRKTRYTLEACVGYYADSDSTEFTYESYIPYRNGNSKSFDFFDYDEDDTSSSRDVEPSSGDSDYYHSSTASETDAYYVQLFAVEKAWNTETCSPSYSLVLDLGSVPIRKDE